MSVNALVSGCRSRTRHSIAAIRHVFLEADHDGAAVLRAVAARRDLPPLSYVLHSSPDRVHLFWRVEGFRVDQAEAPQKQLASELGTDPAATPASQTTRLVGFFNHKYLPPQLVQMDYLDPARVSGIQEFPTAVPPTPGPALSGPRAWPPPNRDVRRPSPIERARSYVSRVPPAVSGEHGDVHTFRVCCRLARGFALDDADALEVLQPWNQRCRPPWTHSELLDKVQRARRYGREPLGGLLDQTPFSSCAR